MSVKEVGLLLWQKNILEGMHNVEVEPSLQPLSGESDQLILKMGHVLMLLPMAFAPKHRSISLPQCYRRVELKMKRKYEERVHEAEHGSFLPLVFCVQGVWALGHSCV